jgi:uncharacterized protein (DUF1778 family)
MSPSASGDEGGCFQKPCYVCTLSGQMSATRSRRIDVRVTDEQDAIIREAAAAAGQTVTAFLLSAAEDRARLMLDERRHLVLSSRAFAGFVSALDEPGERVGAVAELFSLPRISAQ